MYIKGVCAETPNPVTTTNENESKDIIKLASYPCCLLHCGPVCCRHTVPKLEC